MSHVPGWASSEGATSFVGYGVPPPLENGSATPPASGAMLSLARMPRECRRLGASVSPPLVRPEAPTPLALRLGAAPTAPPNLGTAVATTDQGTAIVATAAPGVRHRRAPQATAAIAHTWVGIIAHALGWGVKN